MKYLSRVACMLAIGILCAQFGEAAPILIGSTGGDAAHQYNNSPSYIPAPYANATTISISQNTAWASPQAGTNWVSFYQTGGPLDYVVPNNTTITFTHEFNIGPEYNSATGSITVMADDSTSVSLNGHLLFAEAPQAGNTYAVCSDSAIGCLPATAQTLTLGSSMFNYGGVNKLEFGVSQRAWVSYGLNYAGIVNPTLNPTPEPGTYALLGVGLVGLALLRRRKQS